MFFVKRKNIYYVQINSNGKPKRISTHAKNLREAKLFVEGILNGSEERTFERSCALPENDVEAYSLKTIGAFASEYADYIEKTKSAKYLRSVRLSFKRFNEIMGDMLLSNIKPRDVEMFILNVYREAKHAAHLYHRTLKAAFNKAIVWGYITKNPFVKVKPPKLPKSNPNFITYKELETILKVETDLQLKDIYIVTFYTGMRLGEIINMKWDWVDLEKRVITIRNDEEFTTKSKENRVIPIHKKVADILNKRKRLGLRTLVFCKTEGIKLRDDFVSKRFKKAIIKAGANRNVRFHDLRHSFASNLVQSGVSIYIVKELLGHQSISTTQIYSHLRQDNLIEAIKKMS